MAIDYLSLTGLKTYDQKIKAFINKQVADGDEKSFKYVNLEGNTLKFYTVNPITEGTQAAYEVELPEQDLSNLMQLVKNATENNIAIFDANGQIKDGGIAVSDIATKEEVSTAKDELQGNIDALKDYVGTIPEGYSESTIIAYVNKKAEETLSSASGGSSESAASVLAALNTYKSENDPKVAANTVNITKAQEDIETAQAAADAAKGVADKATEDLATEKSARETADEGLDTRITEIESKIGGISGALHFKGVQESVPEDKSGYNDGDVIIVGNKEYLFNDGNFVEFGDVDAISEALTALTGRVDTLEDIDHDAYKAADTALKEELNTKIEQNAQAITDLEGSLTEITTEQINELFKEEE